MFKKIKDILKLVFSIILIVLFVLFIFNNTTVVKINIVPYLYSVELYLFVVVIFSFIFGLVFSNLLNVWKGIFNSEAREANKKVKKLEKELEDFKEKYIKSVGKEDSNEENK